MINNLGIVQNNSGVTKFLHNLKTGPQYGVQTKAEEREMIEKYVAEHRESELRELLIMHNIRLVFDKSKKYCKNTRDFDEMIARANEGLVKAAEGFDFFNPIMKKDIYHTENIVDETTGKVYKVKYYEWNFKLCKETNTIDYIRFCTFASYWVFKYVMLEFNDKSNITIDNNSISLDDTIKIKNTSDSKATFENFIESYRNPILDQPKYTAELIENKELLNFYDKLHDFIYNSSELTSIERNLITGKFYENKTAKEIAIENNINEASINNRTNKALKKFRTYLKNEFNFTNYHDIKDI